MNPPPVTPVDTPDLDRASARLNSVLEQYAAHGGSLDTLLAASEPLAEVLKSYSLVPEGVLLAHPGHEQPSAPKVPSGDVIAAWLAASGKVDYAKARAFVADIGTLRGLPDLLGAAASVVAAGALAQTRATEAEHLCTELQEYVHPRRDGMFSPLRPTGEPLKQSDVLAYADGRLSAGTEHSANMFERVRSSMRRRLDEPLHLFAMPARFNSNGFVTPNNAHDRSDSNSWEMLIAAISTKPEAILYEASKDGRYLLSPRQELVPDARAWNATADTSSPELNRMHVTASPETLVHWMLYDVGTKVLSLDGVKPTARDVRAYLGGLQHVTTMYHAESERRTYVFAFSTQPMQLNAEGKLGFKGNVVLR